MKVLNLFILVILTSMCISKSEEGGNELLDKNEEKFYSDYIYLIVYLCLWSFLIEISLIIVLHFKQKSSYVANHSFINVMVVIGQIINNCLFIKREERKITDLNDFLIAELIILCVELIQVYLGVWLNSKLLQNFLVRNIFILRYMHRFIGRSIYIAHKVQVLYYCYRFFEIKGYLDPIIAIVIIIVSVLMTHLIVFFLARGKTFNERSYVIKFLMDYSKYAKQYCELVRNFQNNELDSSMTEMESIRLTNDDKNFQDALIEIEEEEEDKMKKEKIKWVVIEDRLFDITEMRHPKGQYILEAIQSCDITREIYGLKSWRFENRMRDFRKIIKHNHSSRTLRFMMKDCIGPYDLPALVMNFEDIIPEISSTSMNFDMLNENISYFEKKKLNKVYFWQTERDFRLGKQTKVVFAQRPEKNHFFNLSIYWPDIFGKYFLLTLPNSKKIGYPVLSLAPEYIKKRNLWITSLKHEIAEELESIYNDDIKELEKLGDEFENLVDKNQRAILKEHKIDDIYTFHLPLVTSDRSAEDISTKEFGMKGPLGLGIGIHVNSTHNYFVFVKDDGILPFTDFLEFLSQKALIELCEEPIESTHPVFHKEYFYAYTNEINFYIYWEITDINKNPMKSLGLDSLNLISKIYSADKNERVNKLLKRVHVVSKLGDDFQGNLIKKSHTSFEKFEDILNNTIDEKNDKVDRYIISGDDAFVDKILFTTKEPLFNFRIL